MSIRAKRRRDQRNFNLSEDDLKYLKNLIKKSQNKSEIKNIIAENMNTLTLGQIADILTNKNYKTEVGQLWWSKDVNDFIIKEDML